MNVVKTMITIVICFCICYLPYNVQAVRLLINFVYSLVFNTVSTADVLHALQGIHGVGHNARGTPGHDSLVDVRHYLLLQPLSQSVHIRLSV